MPERRIIYILAPFPFPAGGVAVIYEHVEILARNGFQAFVALHSKPAVDFYGSQAPLLIHNGDLRKLALRDSDICVIPEIFLGDINSLRQMPARRILFCQGHYNMTFSANPKLGIAEYPIDKVLISSEAIRRFMGRVFGLSDVPLIPCAIDTGIFHPAGAKARQIAFMPRKLAEEAAFIQACFKRAYKEYADVPWVAINGMTRRQTAEVLRASEVFLSLSTREAFGLPPLEAMASGCRVAGYHGGGGREYMDSGNGWWANEGDWEGCIDGLAAALKIGETGGHELARLNEAMSATVARYSRERMIDALLGFWRREMAGPWGK